MFRPRAAAPPRRSRARGGHGPRCRTPCGSGDASSRFCPDSGSSKPPGRCASPARSRLRASPPRSARGRPAGGIEPASSLRDYPLPQFRVGARSLRVRHVEREPRFAELRIEHGRLAPPRSPGARCDSRRSIDPGDPGRIGEKPAAVGRPRRPGVGRKSGREPSCPPSRRQPPRLRPWPARTRPAISSSSPLQTHYSNSPWKKSVR